MSRYALPYRMEKRGKYWYYKRPSDRYFTSTGKKSRTAAVEWVERYRMGGSVPSGIITLRRFATPYFTQNCPWWERENARRSKRAILVSTRQHHFSDLHNHILPRFGDIRLESLHPPDIAQWLYSLPYSSRTKKHIHRTLIIVLDDAYRGHLIYFEPRRHISPPVVTYKQRSIPTMDQLRALFPATLDAMREVWGREEEALHTGIMLSTIFACGLRGGEVRALNVDAVNWEIGGLKVMAAYNADNKLGTPKSNSYRVVLIPHRTLGLLDYIRGGRDDGLLFRGPGGGAHWRGTPAARLRRVLARGVAPGPIFTPHGLRHAYNTRMREILQAAETDSLWDGDSMTAKIGRHTDNVLRAFAGHKTAAMTAHYDHPDLDRTMKFYDDHFRRYVERIWDD